MNYPLKVKYCVHGFLQRSVLLIFYKLAGKSLNGFFHKCRTFCSGHPVIFWYKSVYDSNPSLRASSLFGGMARSYTRVARSQVLSWLASLASRNGELAHRARLIRDLTRELNGVKLL